jgi:hypothetical protein
MDIEELRLNCLRMAYELGGKSEAVISAANDLLSFVTKGPTADTRASALEPATSEGAPCEVSAPEAEPSVNDRIAACGTALEMPESGDLAQAEPAVEAESATEAEPAVPAEETEAVLSQATTEEGAAIAALTAVDEATAPAAPSPEPVEPLAEVTCGGSADPAAAPEVEAAAVPAEPAASASEEVAASSEEQARAAAPVADGSGQEHTAN